MARKGSDTRESGLGVCEGAAKEKGSFKKQKAVEGNGVRRSRSRDTSHLFPHHRSEERGRYVVTWWGH